MRIFLLAAAAFVLAACGDQKPAEPAPTPEAQTPAPAAPAAVTPTPPPAEVVNVPPAEVPAKLAGKWVSVDDDKSTVTISADGAWTEDYAEKTSPIHEVSKWRAFAGADAPKDATGVTFTPTSTYIELQGTIGFLYYELGGIEADGFDMFYAARGNHLAYKRVK